jgi:hypothetical protein
MYSFLNKTCTLTIYSESKLMDGNKGEGRRTHTQEIIYNYMGGKPLFIYLLKGMNGSGGQKSGTFAPGCDGA